MQNTAKVYDWNDLRHFLAVARSGSTLGASRELGVNQTTTARRVAALEEALGVRLFNKLQAGYSLTKAGELVRADAERVEAEAEALARAVEARSRRLSGSIRITTDETIANGFLLPALADFGDLYPDIVTETIASERKFDLVAGEADVALRAGDSPSGEGLVGRRIADVRWGVYCSREYARRRGCPTAEADLTSHRVVGGEGPMTRLPGVEWMSAVAPDAEIVTRSNTLSSLVGAVRAGLGVAAIPCFIGENEPDLVRCLPPVEGLHTGIWLLTTEGLKDVPRVRALMDFLTARMGAVRAQMSGRLADDPA